MQEAAEGDGISDADGGFRMQPPDHLWWANILSCFPALLCIRAALPVNQTFKTRPPAECKISSPLTLLSLAYETGREGKLLSTGDREVLSAEGEGREIPDVLSLRKGAGDGRPWLNQRAEAKDPLSLIFWMAGRKGNSFWEAIPSPLWQSWRFLACACMPDLCAQA